MIPNPKVRDLSAARLERLLAEREGLKQKLAENEAKTLTLRQQWSRDNGYLYTVSVEQMKRAVEI